MACCVQKFGRQSLNCKLFILVIRVKLINEKLNELFLVCLNVAQANAVPPAEALNEHVFVVRVERVKGLTPLQSTVWGEADCYIQYSFPAQEEDSSQEVDPHVVESSKQLTDSIYQCQGYFSQKCWQLLEGLLPYPSTPTFFHCFLL